MKSAKHNIKGLKLADTNIVKYAEALGKTTDKLKYWDFMNYMSWLSDGKLPSDKKVVENTKTPGKKPVKKFAKANRIDATVKKILKAKIKL